MEGNLDNATFVPENTNVPSINLYLNGTAQLRGDKRLGVAITVTKNMMEDSAIDLKDYIESLLVERIGSALEQSIFNGDGSQLGFLGIAKDTNVVSSPLNINAATIDQLRAIQNLVHDKALPNSVWYMNRTFFNEVTRLQDGNKNYYVSYQSGVPYLLGSPIEITGGLAADTASGNIPVVYGDISMGYTCGIAKEIESYTTSSTADALRGTVTFTVYMLVDGCVTNYAALAVGKVA
ncbi:phage major capsid protein [Neobacillus pocheonensis]|uniref:Phage major capsid protein n=1 Tax=Neobacillus pocheonensis TaxID=363869 RepID=A0ABT0W9H7_9BACI|nr:phage major capsid protein [Neobacillus pocheonensis]